MKVADINELATIYHTTIMNENERIKRTEVKQLVEDVSRYIPSELSREELGSELSFEKGITMIENYRDLFKNFALIDFDKIPIQQVDEISSHASYAKSIFDLIKGFSLQAYPNSPVSTRDQFLNTLQDYYSNALSQTGYLIDYFKPKQSVENYEEEARTSLAEVRELRSELLTIKENVNKELNEILDTARQTVSEIGVASHAIHFKNEADENLRESKNWLTALIMMVIITVGWGILCFFIHPESKESSDVLQFTIAKLIVISGLYFALSMITKNYKAHRHNYIVNKHKQNSLNSFEAFVKGAGEDIQTKNAVLISATQSIFSAQPSGYSSQEAETEPSKIIEILKTTNTGK